MAAPQAQNFKKIIYSENTQRVEVSVEPVYLPERSSPQENYYFFAYRVQIHNCGEQAVKLLRRHWIITDGHGHVEEVHGEGVVGEQPLIRPGQRYNYSSACPLPTPTGNMRGHFLMIDDRGENVRVKIPLFFLRHPSTFH